MRTQPLFPAPTRSLPAPQPDRGGLRSIEEAAFPFEHLSSIAEVESWRKEIYRPVYHIHKWWAQRLGSVFRAIVLSTFAPARADLLDLFYSPVRLPHGAVVLDPFMGSGTTLGEVLKAGGRAIGFDINPVAYSVVRNALSMPSRKQILATFHAIERDVAAEIQRYYATRLPDGRKAHVLYYFWVKQLPCTGCRNAVDLFSSYIFADHAYRGRHPDAHALCPHCGEVNLVRYDTAKARCARCRASFDPRVGPANRTKATCRACNTTFPIAKVARELGQPPQHRMYAKLVLTSAGEKHYLAADSFDRGLYDKAERELSKQTDAYPIVQIAPGYNTNQVINYSYTHWHQMFNARQLLCLSILAERIRQISDERLRELFCCLFSGVLEFNNMFTSYKGEGTGAVRHMFYHHILKPEREPLEANVWGTPKSSGAFSTLFERRILRALDYCEDPFELRLVKKNGRLSSTKVYRLSAPLFHEIADSFPEFHTGRNVYLACRNSAESDLPAQSVDAVITDPPFFDNVHYSQLADFFFVWQRHILGQRGCFAAETTRRDMEVQQQDPAVFTDRLSGVWKECHRVLKNDGLLVFTYHHSRNEGWRCVLMSLLTAGFGIVRVHPIKSEMSVATPKHQAHEPIDLDMILVCRKRSQATTDVPQEQPRALAHHAYRDAKLQLDRLRTAGRKLSRNDVRVVFMAQAIARLSRCSSVTTALDQFDAVESSVEELIDHLNGQGGSKGSTASRKKHEAVSRSRGTSRRGQFPV